MQIKRKVRCRQILQHLQVHWDGTVGMCNQSSVLIGDVKTTPLEAIWRGHVLAKVRRLHADYEGHRVDVCKICPVMEPAVPHAQDHLEEARVTTRSWWREEQVDCSAPAGGLVQLRRQAQPRSISSTTTPHRP
jgi:hypothetical protein